MMLRILLVPLLVVASLGSAKGQGTADNEPNAKVREEILKVEEEEKEASLKGDTDTLDRLFANDIAYTNQNGELVPKGQFLAEYRSGAQKIHTFKHDDVRLRSYGDTVVVTGRSTSAFRYKGKEYAGAKRFTNVWVKQGGQWRLVVHHVTAVENE